MSKAEIVSIFTAPEAEAPMEEVKSVEAVSGQGLRGDRYFKGEGTFSETVESPSQEVTLIESEMVEAFNERGGNDLRASRLPPQPLDQRGQSQRLSR